MSDADTGGTTGSGVSRRGALGRMAAGVAAASSVVAASRAVAAEQDATRAAGEVPPDFKVVLHAAEEQNWQYVLSNLRNLTQEWPEAQLRVVVDGSAVLNLQGENSITNELAKDAAAGVEFFVCPNALHEHQIDPSTIPSFAKTHLGGVVALVLAYREGYLYVKP